MLRCLTAYLCRLAVAKRCFHLVIILPAKRIKSAWKSCQILRRWILLLYAITFLLILPILFHDVRHSTFYLYLNKTAIKESMKNANSRRIVQAETYFSMLNSSGTFKQHVLHSSFGTNHTVTVALNIITVSRNRHQIDSYEPKYLTQTVWKFHSVLQRWPLHIDVHMSICNVDSMAASYHEAHTLSKFVPMYSRFNDTHFSLVHTLEKEKQDYVYCLNKSLEVDKEADYVFLVEDDALPTDDVFEVLQHVILMHTEQSFARGEFHSKPSNVAFIKFYHPEWLLNFISFQPERLPELLSYAAVLSSLLAIIYAVVCRVSAASNTMTFDMCWREFFLFSLLVVLACGRTGISEWRRLASPMFYSYTPAPSCCTPAMLFPRSAAQLTVTYLSNVTCHNNFGKDSVLDNMLRDLHLMAYLVQPNTFTHIGLYSSLRMRTVDPFMV